MKTLKAKKDFVLDGVDYFAGDEIKTKDMATIVRLNEKGYIEPLTRKEIQTIKNEIENPKKTKEVQE